MLASAELSDRTLHRRTLLLSQSSILPMIVSALVLCASVLPWLTDPLQESYSAWKLPIDIGWQFRSSMLNYGLLCLCCAIYTFLVGYAHWKSFRGSTYFLHRHMTACVLCVVPVALLLLQYLCIDVVDINTLAQHKIQALLVQQHFAYKLASQQIPLGPFEVDVSTLLGRLKLLVDQLSVGLLPLCISPLILIYSKWSIVTPSVPPETKKRHTSLWLLCLLPLLLGLGRAPAAIGCEYEARALLASGNYKAALDWLDAALVLNPMFNQVSYYHIERGQALYFLQPDQLSDDSRIYLAATYRGQGDYRAAYQQLLAIWQAGSRPSWVIDELSITLVRLSEFIQPLKGPPIIRPDNDDTALPWVQKLVLIDPSNVYGRYLVGRIQYDLHNYTECIAQMIAVTQLSSNADIQSSAYTYMALGDAGQGNVVEERMLLFKAVELDPNYHNNTAREELSGLH